MSCFPCFSSQKNKRSSSSNEFASPSGRLNESKPPETEKPPPAGGNKTETNQPGNETNDAKTFTFRELASATKNFRQECLLGEGGFGRVYKGTLQASGQVVAVKQLDRNGLHGNKEFLSEVSEMSKLCHPNLVNLIGYCADGDQRLLVYDFISGGSLEEHLLDIKPGKKPLDWKTRMKIAHGAADGLEYLHEKADPPVIYRDLKASNILLDDEFNPKLSDFYLYRLGPGTGDTMSLTNRVMGTYGYCAPECSRGGNPTTQSDVYSFGVALLEIITGRRAVDTTRPNDEQNLVAWAQPIFRDPKRYPDMADPLLKKRFPERDINQVVAIASMCLQEEPGARPLISDVTTALGFLSMSMKENVPTAIPILSFRANSMLEGVDRHGPLANYSRIDRGSPKSESSVKEDKRNQEEDVGTDSNDGSESDSGSDSGSDQRQDSINRSQRKSKGSLSRKSSSIRSEKSSSNHSRKNSSVSSRKSTKSGDSSQKSSISQ